VVCFDETSGCSEFMRKTGAAGTIVPYLDTRAAAVAILGLTAQERAQNDSASIIATELSMPNYVKVLERELALAKDQVATRRQYCAEIQASGFFDRVFYDARRKHDPDDSSVIREYVAHCMKGIFKAAPYPGFNDGRYLARYDRAASGNVIPLVHAIRNSAGLRPKTHDCIVVSGDNPVGEPVGHVDAQLRIALHVHLFYADLTPELAKLLREVDIAADLFISCANDAQAREIKYGLTGYRRGRITIRRVPNAGRDIGPLITEFGKDILAGSYDLVGHLHGKKSKILGPNSIGDAWRRYLWDNLLAGDGVWDTVHAEFSGDSKLGMLFAEDRNIVGWTKNRASAEALKARFGVTSELPAIPVFPIGTMFWFRPKALARVLESGLAWNDYPLEPLPYDGTILHAIERLLPTVCEQSGHAWKTIYLRGSSR